MPIDAPSPESPLFSSIFPERLSKGDRKKIEIIEAAIQISSSMGLDTFSYDDLATNLKTTRSHVTYHFKERQELILAMIKYMMASGHTFTFDKMKTSKDPIDQLESYINGFFDFFANNKEFRSLMAYFYYKSTYPGVFRELQTQIRQQASDRIYEILRLIIEEYKQRNSKDLKAIAFQAQSMILGGLMFNLATDNPADLRNEIDMKNQIKEGILSLLKVSAKFLKSEK